MTDTILSLCLSNLAKPRPSVLGRGQADTVDADRRPTETRRANFFAETPRHRTDGSTPSRYSIG